MRQYKTTVRSVILVGLALLPWATAHSETDAEKVKAFQEAFSKSTLFVVPESPAAALLGKSVATLSRPQTVQQLAMEVAEVGEAAAKSKGFSVAFAPAIMFGGKDLTLQKYRTEDALRHWANTEISLGLTDPGDDAKIARRAALGLSWTAYDAGDPRRDTVLSACLSSQYQYALDNAPPPKHPGDSSGWAAAIKEIQPKLKQCLDASAARQRSSSSLKIGLASGWANAPLGGEWRSGGVGFWLAGMYVPAAKEGEDPSRLRLLYRLQNTKLTDWSSTTSSWTTETVRGATLQARYDADGNGTDAILEFGVDRDAKTSRNVKRMSLGVETRLMENLWLVLSVTAKSGEDPSRPSTLVLGKLKYSFGKDPLLMSFDPAKK